jgi:hypothetical protein
METIKAEAHLQISPKNIMEFCQRHRIFKLAFFGSVLREDFGPESDVDMLVEFEPGQSIGFFELVRIETELSQLIGRQVDLRTPQELSRYFRQQVLDTSEVVYEQK